MPNSVKTRERICVAEQLHFYFYFYFILLLKISTRMNENTETPERQLASVSY